MINPDRPESLGRQNDRRRSYLHITRIFYIIYARGTLKKSDQKTTRIPVNFYDPS